MQPNTYPRNPILVNIGPRGFLRKRPCVTCMTGGLDAIKTAAYAGNSGMEVNLHLTRAFDRVSHSRQIKKIKSHGVTPYTLMVHVIGFIQKSRSAIKWFYIPPQAGNQWSNLRQYARPPAVPFVRKWYHQRFPKRCFFPVCYWHQNRLHLSLSLQALLSQGLIPLKALAN